MARSLRLSKQGLEKAEKSFRIKSQTQEYLAGAAGCTRQTVIKFFARRPVEKRFFLSICNELDLEWEEIAELEPEKDQSGRNIGRESIATQVRNIGEESIATQVLTSTDSGEKNTDTQLIITLTGDIESVLNNPDVQAALLVLMQKASGDASLKIEKIEKG